MSLRSKLFIAFAVSILLMAGLCVLLLRDSPGKRNGDEPTASVAPAKAAPGEAKSAVDDAARPGKGPERAKAAETARAETHAVFSADEVWALSGRIVKPDASGAHWPVEGAIVYLKPHPRRTKPEEAPPPLKRVTGADGRFELPGCPGRLSMRMEIDEPSSAFRAFSFQLGDPDATGRLEMGDIPLEPALALKIELVGPKGEPVEKGYILVGRESSVNGLALQSLRMNDSRREAKDLGAGKYVLERSGAGPHSIRIQAPGCAGTRTSVELPREEALVVHLEEGKKLSGTVLLAEGKPLVGAEVQVDSGPNLNEPDPKMLSDEEGRFDFDILSEGEYGVSARAEGYVTERKRNVPAGTEALEFLLAPEAILSGKVVTEEDGSTVARAKVSLYGLKGDSFSADTDSQGLFTLKKVPAGTYTLSANHREYAAAAEERREITEGQKLEGLVIKLPGGIVATGKVVDAQTNDPIPDAQILFDLTRQGNEAVQGPGLRRTGKSGPDGSFEVKGLGEGSYTLSARAKGFLGGKSRKVEIAPSAEKEFTLTLDLGGTIEGRVFDDSGRPIAGATVKPNVQMNSPEEWNGPLSNVWNMSATSDAEGKFRLDGLTPHKGYTIRASHPDHASGAVKGIAVGPREAVDGIEITLPKGGSIRGRVLDPTGAGIAGANVQASEEGAQDERQVQFFVDNSGSKNATTDSDGVYTISALRAGKYTVGVQSRGRMSAQKPGIDVAEGKPTEGVDIVLGDGETLVGRVVDAEGQPISSASIDLRAEGNAQTQTDADGRFKLTGLARGAATIQVNRQGFDSKEVSVNVPARETLIRLERLAKISGNLRAKGQETFRNSQVIAMKSQGTDPQDRFNGRNWRGSNRNDPDGRFEVEVGAGTYILQAKVEGFAPSDSEPITVKAGDRVEGIFIDLVKGCTLKGVVVAKGSGEPIEGANIYLSMPQVQRANSPFGMPGASSDADGAFTLDGIPEGTFSVHASHAKFAQGSVPNLSARAGESLDVRIELGAGGGIRGIVSKAGAPISGAFVYAGKLDGGQGKQANTGADGRFEINGLAEGEYQVSFSSNGRPGSSGFSATQRVTVYEGQVTDTSLDQPAGLRVFGRITSNGAPLRGGRIDVMSAQRGWGGGNSEIAATGEYSLEVPGPGAYMFMIRTVGQRGGGGAKVDVTVPEGSTEVEQDIELPSGEISGLVVDAATGEPVPNAQVMAFPAGASSRNLNTMLQSMRGMSQADSTGRFSITALPPGNYTLRVFVEGYADGYVNGIRIDAQRGSKDNRIAVERGISFRARIVDAQGRPVPGASIFLRDEEGGLVQLSRPHTSGDDGTIDFAGIRPAVYEVSVIHPSYAASRASIEVQEGAEAVLRVQPGGKIVVQVSSRQGRPVEGATVELYDEAGINVLEDFTLAAMMRGPGGALMTAADGSLVVEQVLPGKYRIVAKSGDAQSREERVVVDQGKMAEARLTLSQ